MTTKKTVLDQIEITRSGVIQIRMRKLLVEDDGTTHDLGYHRTVLESGEDIDALFSRVNDGLTAAKAGPVDASEVDLIRPIVSTARSTLGRK